MRAQNYGRIVMTTSSSGLYGNFGQSNYGAAKMALVGLMQTLSIEGAKNDIRVNCLAPTAATRMTEDLMPEPVLQLLDAGAVTPGLLALVAEDAPTRAILCAGAGTFERAHVTLTQGIHVGLRGDAAEQIALAVRRHLGPRGRDGSRERRRPGHARDRQGDAGATADDRRRRARGVQSPRARRCRRSIRSPARKGTRTLGLGRGAVLDHGPRRDVERARRERCPAAAEPAGEHVAGAGARQRGVAGGVDARRCRRRRR